jgi:dihydroorotate dehydrogenase (NAD+) catalytic subunit
MPDYPKKSWPGLEVKLGPLFMKTPLIAASGTFGYGTEFDNLAVLDAFGAITLKAVSLEPRTGNPYPRIVETPSGMLNCIGLENPGVDVFLGEILPESLKLGVPLIANLVGDTASDYSTLAKKLDGEAGLVALEINTSCPNVEHGYKAFATDPVALESLVRSVRKSTKKPLIAKLSPNVTDILPLGKAAIDGGADILNLGNTVLGMSICIDTRKSRLSRDYAGLSGRAIRPIALRIVHQAAAELDCPIIGTGGIYTSTDALEFIIAGAHAVSLGTVNFIHPGRATEICDEIARYLEVREITLDELKGSYGGPERDSFK